METLDTAHLGGEVRKMTEKTQHVSAGYLGPGIWIRIQHRFRTRFIEWLLAVITGLWGVVAL